MTASPVNKRKISRENVFRSSQKVSSNVETTIHETLAVKPVALPSHAKLFVEAKAFDKVVEYLEAMHPQQQDEFEEKEEEPQDSQENDDPSVITIELPTSPLLKVQDRNDEVLIKSPPTNQLVAIGYLFASSFLFSLSSLCVKHASKLLGSQEIVLWRSVITLILNSIMLRLNGVRCSVPPKLYGLMAVRCLAGYSCISLCYYAVSKMVLTEATVLAFTSPVITFVLGVLILREPFDRFDFFCSVMAYAGVLFVARPAVLFPETSTSDITASTRAPVFAICCALGSALAQSISFVTIRKLRELHHLVVIQYFLLFSMVASLVTLVCTGHRFVLRSEPNIVLAVFGCGVFCCAGLVFSTAGLQRGNIGISSIMRYFDVVFVFIWDVTILGEHVNKYSIIGGCIIGASGVVVALRRAWKSSR